MGPVQQTDGMNQSGMDMPALYEQGKNNEKIAAVCQIGTSNLSRDAFLKKGIIHKEPWIAMTLFNIEVKLSDCKIQYQW